MGPESEYDSESDAGTDPEPESRQAETTFTEPTNGGELTSHVTPAQSPSDGLLVQSSMYLVGLIMLSGVITFWMAVLSIVAVLVYTAVSVPYVSGATLSCIMLLIFLNHTVVRLHMGQETAGTSDLPVDSDSETPSPTPRVKEVKDSDPHRGRALVVIAWVATLLAIFMVAQPIFGALRVCGLSIITAVVYGVTTDLIGCHQCIEYFTVGHNDHHIRLLASENPILNALAWGPCATWQLGFTIGLLLTFVAQTPALLRPFDVEELWVPALCIVVVVLAISEIASVWELRKWPASAGGHGPESQTFADQLQEKFDRTLSPPYGFEGDGVDLRKVPSDRRAKFQAVASRHHSAYSIMIGSGLLFVYVIWAIRWFVTCKGKLQGEPQACDSNAFLLGCGNPWRYVWVFAALCHVVILPFIVSMTICIGAAIDAAYRTGPRKKAKRGVDANHALSPPAGNANMVNLQYVPQPMQQMVHNQVLYLQPQASQPLSRAASFQIQNARLVPRPLLQKVAAAPGYNSLIHVGHGLANNVLPAFKNHYHQIPASPHKNSNVRVPASPHKNTMYQIRR